MKYIIFAFIVIIGMSCNSRVSTTQTASSVAKAKTLETVVVSSDTVKKIVKSLHYDLLAHVGWRQPGLELKKTMPIWIRSKQVFDQATDLTTPDNQPLYELEGKITIALARYLHIYTDLIFRRPGSPDNTVKTLGDLANNHVLDRYNLKEHRRMRSKKLHYLDHPEFALLVLITPS